MIAATLVSMALIGQSTVNLDSLTDAQKRELQAQAESMRSINSGNSPAAKEAREWIDIGTAVGKALGSSARELNIAVNEFAETPVGMLTAVLIVWKVVGSEIIHYIFGVGFMLLAIPTWWWMWSRVYRIKKIVKTGWFSKEITYEDREISTDGEHAAKFIFAAVGPVLVIIGLIISFSG